jgi:hypothetical protein
LYPFAGERNGDLSFQAGAIITILKQEGNWWEGECNGKQGLFPANYVQPL